MTDDVARSLEAARTRVTPDDEERATIRAAIERVEERAADAVADLPVDAEVLLVGSTARDTWLPGDRDVDVFVRFPADCDRDELREHGLAVGHAVLPEGTEEYAEHPYVSGPLDDVEVDVVPCYDVPDATEIRSAVDRTPFHTEYVRERLDDELAAEVRLAKAFATAVGVYGSDLRTRGFSGYLLELLVLEYGGARALLEAAADWEPPERLDPADHGSAEFDDPLVVVDPTDPERNVAAVLTAANVARFQHHARAFLADPDPSYFATAADGDAASAASSAGTDPKDFDEAALREHLDRRETTPVALRFPAPDLVEDDLYPQLRTSLRGVVGLLDRAGFDVLRSTVAVADAGPDAAPESADATDAAALLLLELEVDRRPAVERHQGPPVHVREHAERFYETYAEDPEVYGPFVDEEGHYVAERPREHVTARQLLESDALFRVSHGVAVGSVLEDRDAVDLLVGAELAELLPAFAADLSEYFDPGP